MNEVLKRWKNTSLLEGIEDEATQLMTAYVMDNQIHINEHDLTMTSQFKRISIPLIRRVIPYLNCGAEARIAESARYSAILNVEYQPVTNYSLDEEARKTATLAEKLTDAVNAFVFGIQSHAETFFIHGFGLNENRIVLYYDLA